APRAAQAVRAAARHPGAAGRRFRARLRRTRGTRAEAPRRAQGARARAARRRGCGRADQPVRVAGRCALRDGGAPRDPRSGARRARRGQRHGRARGPGALRMARRAGGIMPLLCVAAALALLTLFMPALAPLIRWAFPEVEPPVYGFASFAALLLS